MSSNIGFWHHLDLVVVLFCLQRLLPQYILCTGIQSGIFCHLCLSVLGFGNHQGIKHHSQQDAHKHPPLTNVIFWYNPSWPNPEPILKGYLQHWWSHSQIYWRFSLSLINGSQCGPGSVYYHSCFHCGHSSTRDLLLVYSGMQPYLTWFGVCLIGSFYVTVDKGSDNIIIHSLDYLLNVGCCWLWMLSLNCSGCNEPAYV